MSNERGERENMAAGADVFRIQAEHVESVWRQLISAARVDAVVGQPISQHDRTIVPLAETFTTGGWGSGWGSGRSQRRGGEEAGPAGGTDSGFGSGYGGGGVSRARSVAVVEITPQGTRIIPVVDWTSLGLAILATVGAIAMMRRRLRRAERAVRPVE